MSFVRATAAADVSAVDAQNQTIREAPNLMRNYQKIRVRQATARLRARLVAPTNKPSYPFIWSYDKAAQGRARRWWWANKGGPHQRTGELEAATEVTFVQQGSGGYFLAENKAPGAEYVVGEKQVPSHYLTGWPQFSAVVEAEASIMAQQLEDDWFFVNKVENR